MLLVILALKGFNSRYNLRSRWFRATLDSHRLRERCNSHIDRDRWDVHLRRARRCQSSLQPTDGRRKHYYDNIFGMILGKQPNLPHQRRSLQMGGGHHVPIGRGLRGDTSLQYPSPRCSQFRSSSLFVRLQRWTPKWGFRYLGPLQVFPSVPSGTTMRPQAVFHRLTLSNRQGLLPVSTHDSAQYRADRNQGCQASWQWPPGQCSSASCARRWQGSLRAPVSPLPAWSRLRRRWTFTCSSEEACGSRMNPCGRTCAHTDDGDNTDSLKSSRTTGAEDVLGSHIVSEEKPPLAVFTAPAARRTLGRHSTKPATKAHHVLRG